MTSLQNDYYKFDASRQQLVGERGGRRFGLGEPMHVQVQRVDMDTRRIDFRPVEAEREPARSRRRR